MAKKHSITGINAWPEDDRPREKLLKKGEESLSDAELLAIILRTGVKGQSALDMARAVIKRFGSFRELSQAGVLDWKEFKGLGGAKLAQIRASIEIGKRFFEGKITTKRPVINKAEDVFHLFVGSIEQRV